MYPIQHFKANFPSDEEADATSVNPKDHAIDGTELYGIDSTVRNLCLVWEDGRRAFFNYAYLMSVDLVVTEKVNTMQLDFSGHLVTLKGYQLGLLFDLLLNHSLKTIIAINPRYYVAAHIEVCLVTEILIKSE